MGNQQPAYQRVSDEPRVLFVSSCQLLCPSSQTSTGCDDFLKGENHPFPESGGMHDIACQITEWFSSSEKQWSIFFLLFNVSVQLWLQPCPCAPTWFNPPTLGNARCVTGLLYASPNNTHPRVSIHQPDLYQTYKTHIKLFNANNLCSKNLFLCFKQKLWSRCWKGLPAILGNQKFTRRLRKPLDLSGQICKDRKNIRYKISL